MSMKAINTSGYYMENIPNPALDFNVHTLAWASENNGVEIATNPLLIIPIGKLLLNRHGRAERTGYELCVSGSLAVWMIYEPHDGHWRSHHTVDTGLFPPLQSDDRDTPNDTQTKQQSRPKLIQFCSSLSNIGTTTFEDIQLLRNTAPIVTGDPYLLELSAAQTSIAFSRSWSISHSPRTLPGWHKPLISLAGAGFSIDADSRAGCQLLLLARDNPDKHIVRVCFGDEYCYGRRLAGNSSLLLLAMEHGLHEILEAMNASADISAFADETDFYSLELINNVQLAEKPRSDALFNFLKAHINLNYRNESGSTLLLMVVETGISGLVKSILDWGDVDVNLVFLVGLRKKWLRSSFY
ncbi:hypothetical protein F4808DRAFT_462400 [Astrocystis sublimbata]|nr:hypothetical protein F4808DRAFT_462400 [Astrocystis sublimbata]